MGSEDVGAAAKACIYGLLLLLILLAETVFQQVFWIIGQLNIIYLLESYAIKLGPGAGWYAVLCLFAEGGVFSTSDHDATCLAFIALRSRHCNHYCPHDLGSLL